MYPPIGTALTPSATRLLLLGAGELGKEVALEAMRLGLEVIAVDRYDNAPAMQIAHRSHVINMLDGAALRAVVAAEKPDFIVPEVEAIHTETLLELEGEGMHVVPSAKATHLTMDREGIRCLAAEELKLKTSPYRFAGSEAECLQAIDAIGMPCIVKPVMSSSGKGQLMVSNNNDRDRAWDTAVSGGRAGKARVIVEGLVRFDYEITLLTIRHAGGTTFCEPIGHTQRDGDYRESWQPQVMSTQARRSAEQTAAAITNALGGYGLFGVELFVCGDEVLFSEVSPRPHDTGMVTMISQTQSEFALHVRAILGADIEAVEQLGAAASVAILGQGHGSDIQYSGAASLLGKAAADLRIFAKPEVRGERRLAVALARGRDITEALARAHELAQQLKIAIS